MKDGTSGGATASAWAAGMLALCLVLPAGAQAVREDPAVTQVQALLRTSDRYAAAEWLEQGGEPRVIARRYFAVMSALYWKKHDLPAVLAVAPAGIHFCLSRAKGAPEAEASELRGLAKSMAYDLASFTWPGWNEPGISPSLSDEAIGLDAARLNLRLAIELKRGSDPMFNAHWALGAHQLAAGRFEEAVRSFEQAAETARSAKNRGQELMAAGYALLTKLVAAPNAETEKAYAANEAALVKEKDGPFFRDQIVTARRVFSQRFKN